MCSIVGINGRNVKEQLLDMMSVLSHRGPDGQGIYSDNKIYLNNDIYDANSSDFMLGHNLLSIVGINELQPLVSNNLVLISNAELYNYEDLINQYNISDLKTGSDCEVILKIIEYNYEGNLKEAVLKSISLFDGDYAFCITDGDDYIVIRDDVGVKPLYYASGDDCFAFASEQKALKKIGLTNIRNLNPTYMIFNDDIVEIIKEKTHTDYFEDYETAKNTLKKVLKDAVSKRAHNLDKVALLFSAGVDSTLIAVLLKQLGVNVTLYTIGTENSQDLKFAKKIAKDIDLPLKTRIIDKDVVEESFCPTIKTIEDTNLMKIGVGMTIKLTSQLAREDNQKVILSGQGADELFAGYNRYKNKYNQPQELICELDHDLNNIYDVNLERDDKATMSNSVELRVPFLDKNVINTALKMPISYLLKSEEDNIRKHILRDVAYELGVPEEIAYRPKKAAQYGTGIDKIIRKKIIKKEPYCKILK
ncbi:asparagine synthetase B family protein [Methanosphaera sp.]